MRHPIKTRKPLEFAPAQQFARDTLRPNRISGFQSNSVRSQLDVAADRSNATPSWTSNSQ